MLSNADCLSWIKRFRLYSDFNKVLSLLVKALFFCFSVAANAVLFCITCAMDPVIPPTADNSLTLLESLSPFSPPSSPAAYWLFIWVFFCWIATIWLISSNFFFWASVRAGISRSNYSLYILVSTAAFVDVDDPKSWVAVRFIIVSASS